MKTALRLLIPLAAILLFHGHDLKRRDVSFSEDYYRLLANPAMDDWASARALASPAYFVVFCEGGYRPLASLSYLMTRRVFGPRPEAFKAVKVLALWASCLLLYGFCRRWSLGEGPSVFAAVLYAAHPAHAGLLRFCSFLPVSLAAMFGLLALGSYVRCRSAGPADARLWTALSAAGFAAALLTWETSISLLGILAILEAWGPADRTDRRRRLLVWAAWLSVTISYILLLKFAVRADARFYGTMSLATGASLAAALGRAADYTRFALTWGCDGMPGWLGLAAVLAAGTWLAGWRSAALGALWPAVSVVPVIGLMSFPRFDQYLSGLAPRYAEFGAAGACLLLAMTAAGLSARSWGRRASWALMAGCLLFSARTAIRGAGSEEFFFESAREEAQDAAKLPLPRSQIASLLVSLPRLDTGGMRRADEVRAVLERGSPGQTAEVWRLFSDPEIYADPYAAWAVAGMLKETGWQRLQQRASAFAASWPSIREGSRRSGPQARALLDLAYARDNLFLEHPSLLRPLCRRLGAGAPAASDVGVLCSNCAEDPFCVEHFTPPARTSMALRLRAKLINDQAVFLLQNDAFADGLKELERARRLDPLRVDSWMNRAYAHEQLGLWTQAGRDYEEALRALAEQERRGKDDPWKRSAPAAGMRELLLKGWARALERSRPAKPKRR